MSFMLNGRVKNKKACSLEQTSIFFYIFPYLVEQFVESKNQSD